MPADSYYEDLNERLASDSHCLSEDEAEQEAEEKRVAPLLAKVLLEHMVPVERESTEAEVDLAIELGAEEEERLERRREFDRILREYAAAVKRYGKALVDLGRACDGPKEAA